MKRILSITVIFFTILVLILAGCESENHPIESETSSHENETHSEFVLLSQEELTEFGIELSTAGPGILRAHVSLPGEINIPPDNLAHIHPRFPGMVKKVYKHIGDPVKKGQTLAVIEGNESLTEYEVKSLIDGTIIEKHFTLGEIVNDDTHGFVVADISTVWAMLKLYQKDVSQVKVGQNVIISAGVDQPPSKGKIAYISPIIDENTRTSEARVVLPNPKNYWKPGLFISGQITISEKQVKIFVPKTAIHIYEGQSVVFIQTENGFTPQNIKIGQSNETVVEILTGLKPGQTYVSVGGFTIKAELQKSEFGDGHSH